MTVDPSLPSAPLTPLLNSKYCRRTVVFRWNGFGEGDEIYGDRSAELQDDGSIEMGCPSTMATTRYLAGAE
jgi:hypothetical protein